MARSRVRLPLPDSGGALFVFACCPRYLSLLFLVLVGQVCHAQQCSPPALAPSHALNLFNDQQEYEFGEISAEQIAFSVHVIEDEAVAGRLKAIGDRLIAQMPPTKIQFRFFLVDSPVANAFAIPGGRVYVTRKLISTVRSEDELAGVLGHEMGHQLAHHGALNWSRILHDEFGITKLGDRSDIEEKYNQVLDVYRTKGSISSGLDQQHEQVGADQVAIYAVARAGYSPQAVVDFWDRFAATQDKKGNWLSDVFGNPRPESRRLREFVNDLRSLPGGCIISVTNGSSTAEFERWQSSVRNYKGFGKKQLLRHVVRTFTLDPVLWSDLRNLRFSPDGKYLLAQDDGGIFVLTREPLTNLFYIDAPDAHYAQFSSDSRFVVFKYEGLRIERWNIAEQRMEDVRELYIYGGCVQEALSPDGDYLACLRSNRQSFFPLDFELFDTNTGEPVFTKKDLIGPDSTTPEFLSYLQLLGRRLGLAAMAFSPDDRYFLLGRAERHLLVDLKSAHEIAVPDELRRVSGHSFAFVGPDKVVGAEKEDLEEASEVRFPSGEIVSEHIPIAGRSVYPTTNGQCVIVRPMLKAPLGILDLEAKRIIRGSRTDATDVFGDVVVSERVNGELALYHLREEKPFTTVSLPGATLAHLSAASVSAGASELALSHMSRGAIWDATSGLQRQAFRGFRGAFFAADGLYLTFVPVDRFPELPAKGETEKDVRQRAMEKPGDTLARVDLNGSSVTPIFSSKRRTRVQQFGSVILTATPADDEHPWRDNTLEARDVHTGQVLWSRLFAKGFPRIQNQGDSELAVLSWNLGSKAAKEELNDDPEAKRIVHGVKDAENSYLVEIVDARSGTSLGRFPIDTGRVSFVAREFVAAPGVVAMMDMSNRISLYSFRGEKKGHVFGGRMALSPDGKRLCAEREPGRLLLYSMEPLQQLDEMTFDVRVAYAGFSSDSQELVVVTADQKGYVFSSQPAIANLGAQPSLLTTHKEEK
ncbi:MAG TPA: M48 family metalloprotease [Terriglobales bacterium]|nr:M48 family metalloprotease [Terriglobales bacterium]